MTAMMTVIIAVVGLRQLKKITEQTKAANDQKKKWASIAACERYDSDPILDEATKVIWNKRQSPTDYSNVKEYEREVIILLNYLDSLAIGVEQKLYFETIIRDHMEPIINHAVEKFLLVDPCIFNKKDLQALVDLYNRWHSRSILYRDDG